MPLQVEPLAKWPDGSIRWLMLDFIAPPLNVGQTQLRLIEDTTGTNHTRPVNNLKSAADEFSVDSGSAVFRVNTTTGLLPYIDWLGQTVLVPNGAGIALTDAKGRQCLSRIEDVICETAGPVRTTICLKGFFVGTAPCRFEARFDIFAGTGLCRIGVTIHNPRRARHRGGLWDLGDPGSILFRDLSLQWKLVGEQQYKTDWRAEVDAATSFDETGPVEIYQDSSGGEKWNSSNHVNRVGRVPCSFRGYRVRAKQTEQIGFRASPQLTMRSALAAVSVSVPEFWQQFPKSILADGSMLRVGLFPDQFADLHELQGGEQKTHTVWLHVGPPNGDSEALGWVHRPVVARSTSEWYAESGAFPHLAPQEPGPQSDLDNYLAGAIEGIDSIFAGREAIDEYGWRNYGEIWANHELLHCETPAPVITHFNNQYDSILGCLLQFFRTGDRRWWELADPLARHVADIDIYHTTEDKAAYNGGLFWFTDHYKDAATCTHRTYSRTNLPSDGRPYGGGPGSAHNFTSGLTTYYFLTGDRIVRDAALSLADWVLAMDDGVNNVLGLIDDGPTGLASSTADPAFHGPGRGPGLSINALLDGWLLSGHRAYLDKVEELIGRVVHPSDDREARDLLNVELRWSYTIFLMVVDRYLRIKAELGEMDIRYAYGRSCLLHYAAWMVKHELPYFDQKEQLEYPTETWAAQELRKANVLRLASAYADEPLRSQLRSRGDALADRGWVDLLAFDSRHVARALAIVMVEGTCDDWLRRNNVATLPCPNDVFEFGSPSSFVPQKHRVMRRLKAPSGWAAILLRLVRPSVWKGWRRGQFHL